MRARLGALALAAALALSPGVAVAQSQALMESYGRALALFQAERYAEALPHYERVVRLAESELGPDHPELAVDLNNLAELYRLLGRLDEARPLLLRALAIERAAFGDDSPLLAVGLNNLGLVEHARGRSAEAEELYLRAIVILERAQGDAHPDLAKTRNNLATLYRDTGRAAEARPLYERALQAARQALGPDHRTTRTIAANLAALTGRAPAEIVAAPAAGPSPPAAARAPVAPGGHFAAHLTSVPSLEAVGPEWERLRRRFADILEGQELAAERADLGARGVFHRIRAGPLASRTDAQALCARLAARGQHCSVVPY